MRTIPCQRSRRTSMLASSTTEPDSRLESRWLHPITSAVGKVCLKVSEEKLIPTVFDLVWANPTMEDELFPVTALKIQPKRVPSASGYQTRLRVGCQGTLLPVKHKAETALQNLKVFVLS